MLLDIQQLEGKDETLLSALMVATKTAWKALDAIWDVICFTAEGNMCSASFLEVKISGFSRYVTLNWSNISTQAVRLDYSSKEVQQC